MKAIPTVYKRHSLTTTPSVVFFRALDRWEEMNALAHRPDGFTQDDRDLLQLMQEAACVRNSNRYGIKL
jgi:hypothetical protein